MTDEEFDRYLKAVAEARKTCPNTHDDRGMVMKSSRVGVELWTSCSLCAAAARAATKGEGQA